jgi:hypothetical protein
MASIGISQLLIFTGQRPKATEVILYVKGRLSVQLFHHTNDWGIAPVTTGRQKEQH